MSIFGDGEFLGTKSLHAAVVLCVFFLFFNFLKRSEWKGKHLLAILSSPVKASLKRQGEKLAQRFPDA